MVTEAVLSRTAAGMTLTEVAALAGLGDRARVGVASHDATPHDQSGRMVEARSAVAPPSLERNLTIMAYP
jgi:hypothetical protein